jgi:hypothetical protein
MTRHRALLLALLLLAPAGARAELLLRPPALSLASARGASTPAAELLGASLAAPQLRVEQSDSKRRSALWAVVPFGVGQFANDQPVKGALFFAAETLAFGTFAGTLAAFEVSKVRGELFRWGEFKDPVLAQRLETVSVIAFWSGVGIAALGVLDAFYSRPEEDARLTLLPGAVALRF